MEEAKAWAKIQEEAGVPCKIIETTPSAVRYQRPNEGCRWISLEQVRGDLKMFANRKRVGT